MYIHREIEKKLNATLAGNKSILLLGPRQTGKTTLLGQLKADKRVSLANPADRLRYEKEPFVLTAEIEALLNKGKKKLPLVIIDEIQKVPILMDAVQDLIDRKIAQFILTGSSARKLRRGDNVNLLPGRLIPLRLDPFTQRESPETFSNLETVLLDGALPEITLITDEDDRESLLEAYVTIYLEEEIRAEALVRDIGHFARFLEFAAAESGKIVNLTKLSQEIGVTHSTIASYYQILEDCFVAERIEPISVSKTRQRLTKAQKYILYDLGVRRIAAREGRKPPKEQLGYIFEQYVGLELIRYLRLFESRSLLKFWRDPAGPEVDWVIESSDRLVPIEVKWKSSPSIQDAKHLQIFMNEYAKAKMGFIICQTPHIMKISDNIIALPWNKISEIFTY
ncbi:MAG: ATP-binding protein [Candidatus Berkiella sp.]